MDDQPFSLIANLAKTPPPDQQRTGDKVDFVSAMQTLGYASVFDILRSSKKSFVRKVRSLSDANAELAYENAQCYATQIVRFYRNELISSGRKPALTARKEFDHWLRSARVSPICSRKTGMNSAGLAPSSRKIHRWLT